MAAFNRNKVEIFMGDTWFTEDILYRYKHYMDLVHLTLTNSTDKQLIDNRKKKRLFTDDICREMFRFQSLRLGSFDVEYTIFMEVSCVQLALTGFYNTLTKGEIQCFSCDFSTNILQDGSNPLTLHRERSNCLHLRGLDNRNVPFGSFTVADLGTVGITTKTRVSRRRELLLDTDNDGSVDQRDSGIEVEQHSDTSRELSEEMRNLSSQRSLRDLHGSGRHTGSFLRSTVSRPTDLSRNTPTLNGSPSSSTSSNRSRPRERTTAHVPDRRRRNVSRHVPIPDYRYELCRLQSFRAWPDNAAADPEELANAGFQYQGFDDRVQCYVCQGKLRSWEAEDRPLMEHARHFPQCPFLAGPQAVGNVPLGEEGEDLFLSVLMRQGETEADSSNEMPALVAKGIVSNRPLHPNKVQTTQRLATFTDYPSNAYHKPEDLVKAGFFYTGMVDEVRCYFCNVAVRNWKPSEEPWIQHAVHSPKCGFLIMSKGEAFITRAKTQRHRYRKLRKGRTAKATRHHVSDKRLQEVMSSRVVVSVIEMDYMESLVKKVVVKRLQEVGQEFPNSESLIDSINEFEEDQSEASESEEDCGNAAGNTELSSLRMLKVTDESTGSTEDAGTLEENNQQLRDESHCKVCLDADACIVFLKCGHLVCCSSCAPEMTKCPVCRQNILGTIRVDKDVQKKA